MSIALMTEAFKTTLPLARKMVLLALCDNANDQGECYPSVVMLTEKCSMSERGIQTAIAQLEEQRILTRLFRKGRSTLYQINDPRTWCTPAPNAPPHPMHPTPAPDAPPPPHVVHPTPAPRAPITINEPSIEPSGNHQKKLPKAKDDLQDWLPMEAWKGFEEMRKRKGKPMTDRAKQLILKTLRKLQDGGHDIEEILDKSTRNSWTDIYEPKPTGKPVSAVSAQGHRTDDNLAAYEMLFGKKQSEVIDV